MHAPTRSRPLAPLSASTVSLSHLLFVPELVPVGGNDGVLYLHREVIGVEDGPQHADHRYPGRQPEFDGFFMHRHPGHQVIDGPRDLPPDRPFRVFDQSVGTAADPFGPRGRRPAGPVRRIVAVTPGDGLAFQGRHDVDDALLLALGGPPAQAVLSGQAGGKTGYWPRAWAARGLLHAWDNRATAAIIQATTDDALRVREMAAKVIARHRIGDAFTTAAGLRNDPVPRVRAAADRAIVILTASSS